MAVVLGVSAGFVSAAPSSDPSGSAYTPLDGFLDGTLHTSPSGSYKVTSIGWWQDATNNAAAAFQVAIYNNDASGGDHPTTVVAPGIQTGQSTTANSAVWVAKYTGLNIPLVSNTKYWIAIGVANVANANSVDEYDGSGTVVVNTDSAGTLDETWSSPIIEADYTHAIYAVYEAAVTDLSIVMSECVGSTGHLA